MHREIISRKVRVHRDILNSTCAEILLHHKALIFSTFF